MFGPIGTGANMSGVRQWSADERRDQQQHSYRSDSFCFHDFSF
jgi:hypothetical protein